MNTSPLFPNDTLGPLNHFYQGLRHNMRKGPLAKHETHNDQTPQNGPGNRLETITLSRSLSLEEHLSFTTYSSAGRPIVPKTNGAPQGTSSMALSLRDISQVIKDVEKRVSQFKKEFVDGFGERGPEDLLKKLVLERLFGEHAKGIDGTLASIDQNGLVFDFQLDYEGLLKWKGQVQYADIHFDLHLEAMETVERGIGAFDQKGLKRLGQDMVDTGRYLIGFMNPASLKIYDKLTALSTTIWGDPHIDLSDVDGEINGEFSDLTKSTIRTTFTLLDKTKVVITAPDNGLIDQVDIFKGDHHIKGHGLGNILPDPFDKKAVDAFLKKVPGTFDKVDHDTEGLHDLEADSDKVWAGGDGNDWYDEKGELVWGDAR